MFQYIFVKVNPACDSYVFYFLFKFQYIFVKVNQGRTLKEQIEVRGFNTYLLKLILKNLAVSMHLEKRFQYIFVKVNLLILPLHVKRLFVSIHIC